MRVTIDGVQVDTTEYAEGPGITFTCFTFGDDLCRALSGALAHTDRPLDLQRDGERIPVRDREHDLWPPYSGHLDGAIHRHTVCLEKDADGMMPALAPDHAPPKHDDRWTVR